MPVHPSEPALQVALMLNMARCSYARADWPAALASAARAELIASHSEDTSPEASAKLLELHRLALIVGARAALGGQHFRRALTLTSRLLAAPLPVAKPSAAHGELRSLLREIRRRSAEVDRSNRKLSKGLSEWVKMALQHADGSALEGGQVEDPPAQVGPSPVKEVQGDASAMPSGELAGARGWFSFLTSSW